MVRRSRIVLNFRLKCCVVTVLKFRQSVGAPEQIRTNAVQSSRENVHGGMGEGASEATGTAIGFVLTSVALIAARQKQCKPCSCSNIARRARASASEGQS